VSVSQLESHGGVDGDPDGIPRLKAELELNVDLKGAGSTRGFYCYHGQGGPLKARTLPSMAGAKFAT